MILNYFCLFCLLSKITITYDDFHISAMSTQIFCWNLLLSYYLTKYCFYRIQVYLPDGFLDTSHSVPSAWFHVVLNYIGADNGEGIKMFIDGSKVTSDTTKTAHSSLAGDGMIVVGRIYTDKDQSYTSVQVDELIFFNRALTSVEVQSVYNSA